MELKTLITLLRGINVGRANRISMKELNAIFLQAGCQACSTYVQSGNACVVHESKRQLIDQISPIFAERFGSLVALFVYTSEEWGNIIKNLPYPIEPMPYVTFMQTEISPDQLEKIRSTLEPTESITFQGSCLYYTGKTPGTSKFSNTWVEQCTQSLTTTRNWNTVTAMQTKIQSFYC